MKDLYLTSTFTNPWNVAFNNKIGKALEDTGLLCYLPHRDTNQETGTDDEKFEQDIRGIDNASIILAIAKNESPNFGAELGYAHGRRQPIIALAENGHPIPLICEKMCAEIFRVENLDDIGSYIESLVETIKKIKAKTIKYN